MYIVVTKQDASGRVEKFIPCKTKTEADKIAKPGDVVSPQPVDGHGGTWRVVGGTVVYDASLAEPTLTPRQIIAARLRDDVFARGLMKRMATDRGLTVSQLIDDLAANA